MFKTVLMLTYWIFKIINFGKYPKHCFIDLKSYLSDIPKKYINSSSLYFLDYVISELSKKCMFLDEKMFKCCRSYIKFLEDNFV